MPWNLADDNDKQPVQATWDYWMVLGCLNDLHVQTYVVCGRHLDIFRLGFEKIPCPECPLEPNTEVSYIAEIVWRPLKEGEEDVGD